MPNTPPTTTELEPPRIRLTARLSLRAYDAIAEIQKSHRRHMGRALSLWKVLEAAIIAYAKTQGIGGGSNQPIREPFITIDDCIQTAEELLARLSQLGEQRHR